MNLFHVVASYNGTVSIGATADRNALPDPAHYARLHADLVRRIAQRRPQRIGIDHQLTVGWARKPWVRGNWQRTRLAQPSQWVTGEGCRYEFI